MKKTKILFIALVIISASTVSAREERKVLKQGVVYGQKESVVHYDYKQNELNRIVHNDSQKNKIDEVVHYDNQRNNK